MRIVLLAAGFATRLYPLTRDRAKPLLEVAGRPIVSWILDRALLLDDVREIIVVSNARFADSFRAWAAALDLDVPVVVVDDGAETNETRLGAVRDLALALEHATSAGDVLVASGDNLIDFPLRPYQERFVAEARAPVLLYRELEGPVPPGRHGEVTTDERGKVIRFREKPADPASNRTSIGIYLYPERIVDELRAFLDGGGNPDAPGHFVEWLCQRTEVIACPIGGAYFDIGNKESLCAARREFRG